MREFKVAELEEAYRMTEQDYADYNSWLDAQGDDMELDLQCDDDTDEGDGRGQDYLYDEFQTPEFDG